MSYEVLIATGPGSYSFLNKPYRLLPGFPKRVIDTGEDLNVLLQTHGVNARRIIEATHSTDNIRYEIIKMNNQKIAIYQVPVVNLTANEDVPSEV